MRSARAVYVAAARVRMPHRLPWLGVTSLRSRRYGQHHPRLQDSGIRWQPPVLTEQLRLSRAKPLGEQAPPLRARSAAELAAADAHGLVSLCQSCAAAPCAVMSSAAAATTSARVIFIGFPPDSWVSQSSCR
jgi:hypothetical protein